MDRFMLKLKVTYPSKSGRTPDPQAHGPLVPRSQCARRSLTTADILRLRQLVDEIYMDDKVEEYIVNVVEATRFPDALQARHRRSHPIRRFAPRLHLPRARI